jgi:hypothetical protein
MINSIIFYLLSIIFIWNEAYYIFNKERLSNLFENRDIIGLTKVDVVFYFVKALYWIWTIVGLFSGVTYFWMLLTVGFLKFPLYHINKKVYVVYNNILPILSILFSRIIG